MTLPSYGEGAKVKRALFRLTITLLALHFHQSCTAQESLNLEQLYGVWLHSYEEDEEDTKVYRPSLYDFPPSRGRDGFEFRADGVVRVLRPGPRDKGISDTLRWAYKEERTIEIYYDQVNTPEEIYRLEVLVLSDSLLKVIDSTSVGTIKMLKDAGIPFDR